MSVCHACNLINCVVAIQTEEYFVGSEEFLLIVSWNQVKNIIIPRIGEKNLKICKEKLKKKCDMYRKHENYKWKAKSVYWDYPDVLGPMSLEIPT